MRDHGLYDDFDDVISGRAVNIQPVFRAAVTAWADPNANEDKGFPAAVGRALKLFRLERRMTQTEMAEALKQELGGTASNSVVSQYENGQAGLTWERLVTFGRILRVHLDQLFSLAESLSAQKSVSLDKQLDEISSRIKSLDPALLTPGALQKLREIKERLAKLEAAPSSLPPPKAPSAFSSPQRTRKS